MATPTISARGANSIDLAVALAGGETSYQVEANRSPDFATDESLFRGGLTTSPQTINGLIPDTPYWFRARKTNGGNGAWSVPVMTATLPPTAAIVPYTGFSIEPAILVVPEPIADLVSDSTEAGSDVLNLLNDDPMSTYRATSGAALTFRTPGRSIDTFAILGTLANEITTWRIRGAASAAAVTAAPVVDTGAAGSFRINPGIGRRRFYHAYRRLATPVTLEYWRIDIGGISNLFLARHLVVGLARQSVNASRGAGYSALDLGKTERTQFGAPDRVVGWRGRTVDFPLSWVKEAEFEAKWSDLETMVGGSSPVMALPNPKVNAYLNDRIAFGDITNIRSETMRADRWQKTIEIRSLY